MIHNKDFGKPQGIGRLVQNRPYCPGEHRTSVVGKNGSRCVRENSEREVASRTRRKPAVPYSSIVQHHESAGVAIRTEVLTSGSAVFPSIIKAPTSSWMTDAGYAEHFAPVPEQGHREIARVTEIPECV